MKTEKLLGRAVGGGGNNGREPDTLSGLDTGGDLIEKDYECMDTDHSVKDGALDIAHRVLREHGIEPYTHSDALIMRPPLKGVSAVIPVSKLSDIQALTEEAKREVELTSQIDVLIEERREIRRDLVGVADIGTVCDPVPGTSGLPPRGSSLALALG